MLRKSKTTITPKFYEEIHNNWSDLHCIDTIEHSVILNQVIWKNRYLTINKRPFMWKEWIDRGIVYIQDIVNDEGNFLSQTDISNIYNIKCNFLNAMQIRQSIPSNWRTVIQVNNVKRIPDDERNTPFLFIHNKKHMLENTHTNTLYWIFVEKKKRPPACIKRWTENYPNLNFSEEECWKNIFTHSFHISRDTILQSFQYRLIHRIIPCNEKLYEWNIVQIPACSYCNQTPDNIVHYMLYCPKAREFWLYFFPVVEEN